MKLTIVAVVSMPLISAEAVLLRAGYGAGVTVYCAGLAATAAMMRSIKVVRGVNVIGQAPGRERLRDELLVYSCTGVGTNAIVMCTSTSFTE